ncbi:DUF7093 family protein [Halogranum rubrum]|uniref:Uncharacterized protein n=1 Tax=Halogranum salarium B-1 TaxID=1210908 RepID=J3JFR3_9EURY|nr:hypothetical protein [Halogranum salarium]EJN59479.1 hypothetical protein HSB1_16370 [Halogranum salarium B-1]
MGLRCLLGHDFADPEIEREREEEGAEMVVTVREVKTCTRCGQTQILSENKEVTSIRPARSDEPDPAETDDAATEPNPDSGGWGDANSSSFEETTAGDDSSFVDDDFEPPQTAEEDDGVILEDDDEEDDPVDRQPGEWPDSDDVGREPDRMPTLEEVEGQLDADATDADSSDTDASVAGDASSPWPEQQGEDEGFAAEPHDDDEGVEVDFGNKLAPELGDDTAEEGYDAEFIGNASDEATTHDSGSSGGFARTETLSREDAADLQTEYYCPACEMTRAADKSSMRAGDICPECKHGYITERER